jgi:hypothetical protein
VDDLNPSIEMTTDSNASRPSSNTQRVGAETIAQGVKSALFNGTKYMKLPSLSDGSQLTIIAAARSTADFSNDQTIINPVLDGDGETNVGLLKFTSAGASAVYRGVELAAPFERDNKPKVITTRFNGSDGVNALADLRVNGVDVVKDAPVGGAPNFVGGGGYLGTLDTASAFLTGNVYALAVVQGYMDGEDLLTIERWFNSLAPSEVIF